MPPGFPCCPTPVGGRASPVSSLWGQGFYSQGLSAQGNCPQHHPAHPPCPTAFFSPHHGHPLAPRHCHTAVVSCSTCSPLPHCGVSLPVSATLRSDKERYLSAQGAKNQFTRFHFNPSVPFLINVLVLPMESQRGSDVQQMLTAVSVKQPAVHWPGTTPGAQLRVDILTLLPTQCASPLQGHPKPQTRPSEHMSV